MALFDKKYCDVCGAKIGLLGNKKLSDGNLCKNCAKQLSPWTRDRRQSSVDEIKSHLDYREQNKEILKDFNTTKTLGNAVKVYIDEDKGLFLVSRSSRWQDENPDIMEFSQVTGCHVDVDESRTELKRKNAAGEEVGFNPPRYEYSYDFTMRMHINSPWFNEISFPLTTSSVTDKSSPEYREAESLGRQIEQALKQIRTNVRAQVEEANAPKQQVKCPHCGAATVPTRSGSCEYCQGVI